MPIVVLIAYERGGGAPVVSRGVATGGWFQNQVAVVNFSLTGYLRMETA